MEWCPARWSVCLPLLIFPCTMKSRSSLLAPAHPDGPRKGAVKQLWCGALPSMLPLAPTQPATLISATDPSCDNSAHHCLVPKATSLSQGVQHSWKFTKSLEIFWFSLRVCAFVVNISYSSCSSECISTKYLAVNQNQLILRLVISVSVS